MALLRKCIATVALSGTLPEKLEAAAAVGFDGVEIMEADLLSFDGSPGDVRRIADSLGLGIDLYQPFRDFEAMPDAARARNLDRAERNFPGRGGLDVTSFVRAVLASGCAGPLSLEMFNEDFRSAPAWLNARDGLRSLVLARGRAGGGAGLPLAPALEGVEFLESAMDGGAGADLAAFLGSLGFRHAGRHRSKAVDLYRQGGISMLRHQNARGAAAGGAAAVLINCRSMASRGTSDRHPNSARICRIGRKVAPVEP